ncbi:MAG: hypothetical protein IKD72_10685, partial [Clostridia bacterium]|nr:hypothetical protein [Clostridia bacterium]
IIAPTVRRRWHEVAVGGQCRERCFSVPHAPQAHHSLRLASLDTFLREGGYFSNADAAVHSAGKCAADAATARMYARPTVRSRWIAGPPANTVNS